MVDIRNEKKGKGIQTWSQAIQPKQNPFVGNRRKKATIPTQSRRSALLHAQQNPKEFYWKFRKPKSREANIHPDHFFDHFKYVASDTSVRYPALTINEDTVFEELDGAISEKEMIDLKGTNQMG